MKHAFFAAVALAFAIPLSVAAQNQRPARHRPRPPRLGPPGFAEGAMAFPVGPLRAQLARQIPAAKAKGSVEKTLEDFGSYKLVLSVYGRSGGAEVEAHRDEVMLVEQGSAVLITGGRVIDGQTNADGDTRGMRIEGGKHQQVGAGDVVTVRAGTPHQLVLSPGAVFSALVIEVREP